jgi:predicted Zn-dependent protease
MSLGAMKWLLPAGLVLASLTATAAQPDVVSRALYDEMQRSMQKLQMEHLERPYFISYQVTEDETTRVSATLGSVVTSARDHVRRLSVSVRVGDYALDSSGFRPGPQAMAVRLGGGVTILPLDDDYQELRRQIWLATDRAYKVALEDLAGKRASLEERNRTGDVASFSRVAPAVVTDLAPSAELDLEGATRLVREASALFRQAPRITSSTVQLVQENRLQRYLSSEGSQYTVRLPQITLRISAETEAPDGRALGDVVTLFARRAQDLPSATVLSARVRALQEELEQLQGAPLTERYEGPVLFEGAAAGELFVTRFAANLPATPAVVTSSGQVLQTEPSNQGSPLLRRIGLRVLPEFLDVVDDPTLERMGEVPLLGRYKVDQEGVTARRTLVVEQGVLKTVLTSRAPVEGIPGSTANMRERGVAASNLLVSAQKGATLADLRKQVVQLAQGDGARYAVVIRRLQGDLATLAYRLYPDGREELLRNARLEGLNLTALRKIVAVSSDSEVYTRQAPARPLGGSITAGGDPLISCVVPSLLLTDVTVDRPQGEGPKTMLIPSPLEAGR